MRQRGENKLQFSESRDDETQHEQKSAESQNEVRTSRGSSGGGAVRMGGGCGGYAAAGQEK